MVSFRLNWAYNVLNAYLLICRAVIKIWYWLIWMESKISDRALLPETMEKPHYVCMKVVLVCSVCVSVDCVLIALSDAHIMFCVPRSCSNIWSWVGDADPRRWNHSRTDGHCWLHGCVHTFVLSDSIMDKWRCNIYTHTPQSVSRSIIH